MSRRADGFTLLEIIIATSLFTLLMASYYTVVLNVLQLEEYARDQRSFATVGPAVLDLIEDDVLSTYTHPRALDAYPFRGEDDALGGEAADRMNFVVTRASVHREEFHQNDQWVRSPINEVGYRLARADPRFGDVRKLFRRETYYVDSTPLQGGDYYEVYDRVVAFDVEYVGFPVEESERTDQETLGEHNYETFESWDSEQRKFLPTALVVTLTIEPPQLSAQAEERDVETPLRRTFVRIIRLVQADDVLPPQAP
ncbi:MAG: PulJ/GspJ family protein [Planctomycetota bacterium]|jgi:prepilin-type N-terminal cleavage/methylation domain-containing protein